MHIVKQDAARYRREDRAIRYTFRSLGSRRSIEV